MLEQLSTLSQYQLTLPKEAWALQKTPEHGPCLLFGVIQSFIGLLQQFLIVSPRVQSLTVTLMLTVTGTFANVVTIASLETKHLISSAQRVDSD